MSKVNRYGICGLWMLAGLLLAGCGGGSSSPGLVPGSGSGSIPPELTSGLVRISGATPFTATCNGASQTGILYLNAEVEPNVAVNPTNPANIIGAWQQDRWSTGGAQGLMAAASFDGGKTWTRQALPLSNCAGGSDLERASDPWVSFAPDGTAYAISISFNDSPGKVNGVLVTRSTDGGASWSAPTTLIRDTTLGIFNDKESITADPLDSNYVYAVWDRLNGSQLGPTYFARTIDGGQTWEPAQKIYDPGVTRQTINNIILVLPDGTVVDMFTEIDFAGAQAYSTLRFIRSSDHGASWSAPVSVSDIQSVGVTDPESGTNVRDGSGLADVAVGPNGTLYAVWQDSRFSNGDHDGIAYSYSTDGGTIWSTPVEINGVPSVQAFTPSVAVRADGTIGVTYFDFRDNTGASSLPTTYWLAQSTDGVHWSESQVAGPFDLITAPYAEGLFLGDYQGLDSVGSAFLPFFVKTNSGDTSNRTDVWARPPSTSVLAAKSVHVARQAPPYVIDAGMRARMSANTVRLLMSRPHHIAIPEGIPPP